MLRPTRAPRRLDSSIIPILESVNRKGGKVFELRELATRLASMNAVGSDTLIVTIDGHPGSGKSTLASALMETLGCGVLGTDTYVQKERDGERYVDLLDGKQLQSDFESLCVRHSTVLVEGVCIQDTLERLGQSADLLVYCKRITQAGLWADDPTFDRHPERSRDSPGWLDSVVYQYHLRVCPHGRADVIIEYHADMQCWD